MNKPILIAPIVAVLLVGAISTITTSAQASIIGNFGSGWDDGKAAADTAYNSGQTYDSSCPRDFIDNISYCTAYHGGYYDEWSALKAANFNHSP
jgi:hypothetical protein